MFCILAQWYFIYAFSYIALSITRCGNLVTCELRVTSYELKYASCELEFTKEDAWVANQKYKLKNKVRIAKYELKTKVQEGGFRSLNLLRILNAWL